jgi:prepilin-type N-terminal cleavage/methylation domain-containing protein
VSIRSSNMFQGALNGRSDRGFTMVEMLLVIAIIGIVTIMAIIAWINQAPTMRADSGMLLVETQIRQAREAAIDHRANYMVTFQGTSEMVTCSSKLIPGLSPCPNTNGPTATPPQSEISDIFIDPNQMTYTVLSGVPDTPDGFGNTTTCVTSSGICFNSSSCGTTPVLPCYITFQSDGTVVNSSGVYMNGTIFMGQVGNTSNPANPLTARAITILGTTGRVKGYRYNGKTWF